ncbi:MAG: response regulator transcription factor [Sedimentisphaerales bacterium]|nr:response regulator transcription factor [Sedimentisphaerales bacterium]
MTEVKPVVFVVDDDPDVLKSLRLLIKSVHLDSVCCGSAEEFWANYIPDRPGCLVLDIRMPSVSGIELQQELIERKIEIPVIFLSGHADVPLAVQAMRDGAFDFLEKPFQGSDLLDRIRNAISTDTQRRKNLASKRFIMERLRDLSPRQRQIMQEVLVGKTSRQIAEDLGISHKTVEVHRTRLMEKLGVKSSVQLTRMLVEAGLQ